MIFLFSLSLQLLVPAEGIPAGSIFSYESGSTVSSSVHPHGADWTSLSGNFALSVTSDTLFLYCVDDDMTGTPTVPVHLTAVTYSTSGWVDPNPNPSAFTSGTSSLPIGKPPNTVLTLRHRDNYIYIGPRKGIRSDLLYNLSDGTAQTWIGSDSTTGTDILDKQAPFIVEATTTPKSSSSHTQDLRTSNGLYVCIYVIFCLYF